MQLYIIRHAQSENNAIWSRTGSSEGRFADPDITEIGHRQAQVVARFLAQTNPEAEQDRWDSQNRAGYNLTHLYSSYMLRAVKTGTYISEAIGLPLLAWEGVHEWGGLFEDGPESGERIPVSGLNRPFFEEHFPEFVVEDVLGDEGWWNHRPYETPVETLKRAARFLNELVERHDDEDRVGIVTHGGFSDSLLKILVGSWPIYGLAADDFDSAVIPEDMVPNLPEQMWFRLNNVSISRIDFTPNRSVVVYWNRVDFLPDGLIT